MRAEADGYALDTLVRLREQLDHVAAVVNNGIAKLESEHAERATAAPISETESGTAQ
jgi:hypothetical protein